MASVLFSRFPCDDEVQQHERRAEQGDAQGFCQDDRVEAREDLRETDDQEPKKGRIALQPLADVEDKSMSSREIIDIAVVDVAVVIGEIEEIPD